MKNIKFEYLFEKIREDGRSIEGQIWTLDQIEGNEIIYDKNILIARRLYIGYKCEKDYEIFEGDILACWGDDNADEEGSPYSEDIIYGVVKWGGNFDYPAFEIYLIDKNGNISNDSLDDEYNSFSSDYWHFEKIGDIYRNKDLLKRVNNG